MDSSSKEEEKKKKINEIKTFSVPLDLVKTKGKTTLKTNVPSKLSKEQIINQAINFHLQGNILEAIKYYEQLISQGCNDHRVFSNYGVILRDLGKLKRAELFTRKAIELNPDFVELHSNLGSILQDLGKLKEAELSQRKAIELKPNFAEANSNLGNILRDLGKLKEAELFTRKAIELKPDFAEAHSNLGTILHDLGKLKEAENSHRKAIKINPDFANAYSNLGNVLRDLGKLEQAKEFLSKAIEIKSDFVHAYYNLGNIFIDLGKYNDAENFYKNAINLDNNFSPARLGLIVSKGNICDWDDQNIESNYLDKLGIEGLSVNPLGLFYYEDNPLNQLKRAKKLYKEKYYKQSKIIAPFKNKKIHVGYFSADFRNHPMMYLICSMLKLHDKSKFNIYIYSFVPKEDEYTQLAKNSGCIFRDIKELNYNQAVDIARKDKLDIAIDLMGYTLHNRMEIFSYRVAPIQINYLGYPGSLGADAINYIISDSIVIPKEYERYYSEKIIRMPDCYYCTNDKMEIYNGPISRKDFNLPEKGFIFTCFCANKKITSKEFDIWMRLLIKIKGSVIWLYQSNKYSVVNLIKEAEKRNVDPDRLIFASKLPLKEHLARHALGDLALDTFNYNGHTTTTDALWAGLPVLTKIGESFAARVSASILTSIDLPELITYNEKEYEEKALEIARNPEKLISIKSKLGKLKETSPLFNCELFTKNLERKFIELVN